MAKELTVVKSWPGADPETPSPVPDSLNLISQYESGNQNVPNYRYGPGYTAQGYYQITNTNWNKIAPLIGIDTSTYPNAMSAPKDAQAKVATYLLTQTPAGIRNWTDYNPRLRAALDAAPGPQGTAARSAGAADTAEAPVAAPAADSGSTDILGRISRGENVEVTPEDILRTAFGPTGVQIARTPAPQPPTEAPVTVVKSWAPPPPEKPVPSGAVANFAKNFWGDMTQAGQGMVDMFTHNPLDTVKAIGASQDAIRLKAQDAMKRGDYIEAARHAINYLIPFVGPSLDVRGNQAQSGDVSGALGGTLSTAAQMFGPNALESAVTAAPRVLSAVGTAADATKAAVKAGVKDVTVGGVKTAAGVALAKAGPLGEIADVIAGIPIVKSGLKQMGRGVRAGFSAGKEALATPPVEPPPGGMGVLSPDYFDRLGLPPGSAITPAPPAPPDPSFVRSVPAVYPTGPNPMRALPAPPDVITPPAPADTSFVRAVPAQYPEVEPGFQPSAAAAPALSFDDLARSLTGGKSPSRLTEAERANVQNVYDRITKGLSPEEQPPPATPPASPAAPQAAPAAPEAPAATQQPSTAPAVPEAPQTLQPAASVEKLTDYVLSKKIVPHMIDRLPAEYWQMIADDAGTAVPTAEQIAQIKANVAAKTVKTPAQGEQVFQEQKARIEEGMTPPGETPPAAPPAGVVLQPLPSDIPPHYSRIQAADSTTAATRAFLKDQRIADYVLGKGITPEEFEAMPLEEQNKLVVEAPAASKKGKHLPFLPKPEGAAPRAVGRWAEEGIRDIADTMRWRQAQTPEATPPAGVVEQRIPYDWKAEALKQIEAQYAEYKQRLSTADAAWDAAESKLSGERLGPVTFKDAVTGEGPSISSQTRAVSAEDARAEAYANWKAEHLDPLEEVKRTILDSAKTAKAKKVTTVDEAYQFLKDRYTPAAIPQPENTPAAAEAAFQAEKAKPPRRAKPKS